MKRLIYNIIIFLSAPFLPWIVPFCFAVLGFMIFPRYIEGVFLFFVADATFNSVKYVGFPFPFGVSALIIYLLVGFIKKRMR